MKTLTITDVTNDLIFERIQTDERDWLSYTELGFEGSLHLSGYLIWQEICGDVKKFDSALKEIFFKSGNLIRLQEICGVKNFDALKEIFSYQEF